MSIGYLNEAKVISETLSPPTFETSPIADVPSMTQTTLVTKDNSFSGLHPTTRTKGILVMTSDNSPVSTSPLSMSSSTSSSMTCCSIAPPPSSNGSESTEENVSSPEVLEDSPKKELASDTTYGDEEEKTTATREPRPNVKFAPLPELAPRKRRSNAPLGVAARSQLVRRRRALAYDSGQPHYVVATPMWTEEELEQQKARMEKAWEKEKGKRQYYVHEEEESVEEGSVEDPLVVLGRLMKVAGKNIWRKVSKGDGKDATTAGLNEERKQMDDGIDGPKGDDRDEKASEESDRGPPERSSSSSLSSMKDCTTTFGRDQVVVGDRGEDGRSWEEIERGKDLPVVDSVDRSETAMATRKKKLWNRVRTESKPKPVSLFRSRSGKKAVSPNNQEQYNDSEAGREKRLESSSPSRGLRRSSSI
ncbi:hypothetical protein AMATHDRAFT_46882 [Amanita thiersii Skay4041]|uniref:Uncharacterized protein n=1 Tax=Amanita thiersii Skay4041 TaxID=703135 RepID=A0A2A9NVG8_9AGAR|nr:hypothetical protein AMATHDRAFT_46882 [Amanita thiersii Skay4041]